MSNASGTTPINIPQLDKIVGTLNAAENATCSEIALLIHSATTGINDLIAGIGSEIKSLESMLPILSLPGADPAAILGYLSKLVTGIAIPQLKAMINYVVQLVQMVEKFAEMISGIQLLLPSIGHCDLNLESGLQSLSIGLDSSLVPVLSTVASMQSSLLSFAPGINSSVLFDTSSVSNFKNSVKSNSSAFSTALSGLSGSGGSGGGGSYTSIFDGGTF